MKVFNYEVMMITELKKMMSEFPISNKDDILDFHLSLIKATTNFLSVFLMSVGHYPDKTSKLVEDFTALFNGLMKDTLEHMRKQEEEKNKH